MAVIDAVYTYIQYLSTDKSSKLYDHDVVSLTTVCEVTACVVCVVCVRLQSSAGFRAVQLQCTQIQIQ